MSARGAALLCVLLCALLSRSAALVIPRAPGRLEKYSQEPRFTRTSVVVAKKGKPNVPVQFRGAAKQREQMRDFMDQQEQAQQGDDGVPTFNLFVRSKKAGIWYPCGALKGDARSTALVNAWQGKFLRGLYKSQLDRGVARSVFEDEKRLIGTVMRSYPQLKASKTSLEFGYKVSVAGIEETIGKQEVTLLDKEMMKGLIDNVKDSLGFE
mmetsp:Transcript_11499/g.42932  ORF Transcript_11499/g.42932 Transcript_11499/m.42932 type:complete len:210 (-) Transcript_11499:140-769(-)